MSVTILDLLDGNSGSLNLQKGWTFDRIATVTGVAGDGHEKIINATNTAGIPKTGSQHPSEPDTYLQDIQGLSISGDVVKLVLKYRGLNPLLPTDDSVILSVGSALSQVETNVAFDGTALTTQYTYPADYAERPELRGKTVVQPAIISKLIPQTTNELVRLEDESPLIKSATYTSKVNSVTWANGAPFTWLCTGIIGRSQDSGFNYHVTYSFQFRPDTWNETIVFEDPQTGHPPVFLTPAAEALGIINYRIYESIDFGGLNLGL